MFMKIIEVVLGKANPERMNGINQVAHYLSSALVELGHEVTLWGIASNTRHDYPPRNYETVLFQQLPQKWKIDRRIIDAIDQLEGAHVVHLHGAFIPEFYWIARKLQARGIPYVYTPHGALTTTAMRKNGLTKRLYFRLFESRIIRRARMVQLLGINEYRCIDHWFPVPHKCLVPNGIDLSEIPDVRPDLAPADELVFGFCGRMDNYYKGLDQLFEALRKFLDKGLRGRIELIGDGPDRAWLEAHARQLGIADKLVFHGARFGEEKFRLLARTHVFVLTSRSEGFPIGVLEAAGMGLPCLTTEPTNVNSFIRQYAAGFPVREPGDAEAIAEAMEQAYDSFVRGELPACGSRARRMAEEAFNWKHIARQMVRVYAGEQPVVLENEINQMAHAS